MFGTPEQQERWLVPLLEGEIRSCFGMTEPEVASSDATNMATRDRARRRRVRRQRAQVVEHRRDGRRAARSRSSWASPTPTGRATRSHSMILVPLDAPGVTIERDLTVFGYHDQHGHADDQLRRACACRPANLIGEEGAGFAIAQARLGPGRIHHCMRMIGLSERALELMVDRVSSRRRVRQAARRARA